MSLSIKRVAAGTLITIPALAALFVMHHTGALDWDYWDEAGSAATLAAVVAAVWAALEPRFLQADSDRSRRSAISAALFDEFAEAELWVSRAIQECDGLLKLANGSPPPAPPFPGQLRGFLAEIKPPSLGTLLPDFLDKFDCFSDSEAADLSYAAAFVIRIVRKGATLPERDTWNGAAELAGWWKSLLTDASSPLKAAVRILGSHLPNGELLKRQDLLTKASSQAC